MSSTEVIKRKIALKEQLILLTRAEIDDLKVELQERDLVRKSIETGNIGRDSAGH